MYIPFKRALRAWLAVGGLAIVLVNALAVAYVHWLDWHDGIWIEEKVGKLNFLVKRLKAQPDFALVGSSTTQNHFDTGLMNEQGLQTVNLGLAGRQWEEYPFLVNSLADKVGIGIVVNIPPSVLFNDPECPSEATWYDLFFHAKALGRFDCIFRTDTFRQLLPYNRYKRFFVRKAIHSAQIDYIQREFGEDVSNDARGLNNVRGNPERYVVTYSNGDGQVFSRRMKEAVDPYKLVDYQGRNFNRGALRYLSELAKIAENKGKSLVVVLEQLSSHELAKVDVIALEREFGDDRVKFIDNSGRDIGSGEWADTRHVSKEGTLIYTERVIGQLKRLFGLISAESTLERR